jgi:hypothetical protein
MSQWGGPGDRTGNYFALPGTPALGLEFIPHGRVETLYEATTSVQALRSTAASVTDSWSIPSWNIDVPGGGLQYFVPQKNLMRQQR